MEKDESKIMELRKNKRKLSQLRIRKKHLHESTSGPLEIFTLTQP